ncbi:thiolase family protein [Thermodesulfobacteriota bacterium]
MAKRVAICAVAQTPFESFTWHKRFQEMAFDVVDPIVKQTGVTFDEDSGIRMVVTNSDDVFDARTISDNAMTDAVGAHFRCEEKVAQDGINAIGYGLACILSGHQDLVLVVGHCKESQSESRIMCTNLAFDPFYGRPLGLDYLNAAALQARAYMNRSGVTDEHLARIVVRSREKASKNPVANAKGPVSADDVMNSAMLCDPIREMHAYPVSDGAIAMLLASEERAAEFTDKPVWITGFANCMDSYFLGDRDLADPVALKKAANRAFKMAGVEDPKSGFDLVEVNDCYAYQLPMWAEGLGLCDAESGGAWIDDGGMENNNVNPSGGMLAGNPIMIGGLARAAETVIQLRGDAGERQIDGAKRALAHGTTGPAGQHQSILVLERE